MISRLLSKSSQAAREGNSKRGSVLMVALILSGVIALSLTSYLNLAMNASKMANRSFYMDGSQNLADLGLEQALWSINNDKWTDGGFATSALKQYQGIFPSATTFFTLSGGNKGQVRVWADLTDATKPHVVTKATITLTDGSRIDKYSEAYLVRRSYFDNGMVGDTIEMKGGVVSGDSWKSDPDNDPSTPPEPYSSAVAKDGTRFGATSVQPASLDAGNAKLRGSVAVGSPEGGGGLDVGANGSIGDKAWVDSGTDGVQAGHATYDFTASFPDEKNPVPPAGAIVPVLATAQTMLPRRNSDGVIIDTPASDGNYYYSIPEINLVGNADTLVVHGGKVIITTTNTTGTTIKATGNNSGIIITPGSGLKLYTAGDVSITGKGIMNGSSADPTTASPPIAFQLYGTRSSTTASTSGNQSFDVRGNGYLSGVIYAPNANITVNGGGDIFGAAVGGKIVLTGGSAFHYDESLPATLATGLWKLRKWRELTTPAERESYEDELTF